MPSLNESSLGQKPEIITLYIILLILKKSKSFSGFSEERLSFSLAARQIYGSPQPVVAASEKWDKVLAHGASLQTGSYIGVGASVTPPSVILLSK